MFAKLAGLFATTDAPTEADEKQLSQLAATALLIELCRADNNVDEVEIAEVLLFLKQRFV